MDPAATLPTRQNAPFASVLSFLIPGAGQFYLKNRQRGLAVLAATVVLAYLVNWALSNFKIGLVTIGALTTSWLWLLLALFWAWNIFDAYRHARGQITYSAIGLLLPALIIYVIGWQVTDA